MRPKISEIDLHRSVADFLSWTVLPPAVWTTFPAGWTGMNRGAAGRLKGCGLKAGMPDILVFYNGFTMGIELKTETGVLSPEQKDMFSRLKEARVFVQVCHSIEEVYDSLYLFSIPMREFSLARQESLALPKGRRKKEPAQGAAAAQ